MFEADNSVHTRFDRFDEKIGRQNEGMMHLYYMIKKEHPPSAEQQSFFEGGQEGGGGSSTAGGSGSDQGKEKAKKILKLLNKNP